MRFDRQIQTALRLIEKNGEPVIWRSLTDVIPDVEQPWRTTVTAIEYDAIICFLTVDLQTKETLSLITKTEVTKGMVLGLMGTVIGFTPSLKDTVVRHATELRILSIDVLSPNGQIVLHTIVFEQ